MKPAAFDYVAPTALEEAIAIHSDFDVDSVLLAGGQSLMPLLNMRMALPEVVIDLGRIDGLDGYRIGADGTLRIEAMTRMRTIELAADVAAGFPLLTEALGHVAHVGVRTRGTIGGCLSYAEPAAELPAVMTALEADFLVRGTGGERRLSAADFYLGPMTTALDEGEILTAVEVPAPPAGSATCFLEAARTHGAFALVGVAAVLGTGAGSHVDRARLVFCGIAGAPWQPDWLEELVVGREAGAELFEEVGRRIGEEVEPMSDEHADGEYRRQVAATLAVRALEGADRRLSGEAG